LISGGVTRWLWGRQKRFDASSIANNASVRQHFVPVTRAWLPPDARLLDIGCGPGGFMLALATCCRSMTGVDLSEVFVEEANRAFSEAGLTGIDAHVASACALPFSDATFDAALMVDSIHHIDQPRLALAEALRVLRPGGRLVVFEPNRLNPLLALLCALDRNEWGALALGNFSSYRRLLPAGAKIIHEDFSGLLIGPQSGLSRRLGNAIVGWGKPVLGWLAPKLVIVIEKTA
jgi:ubiquinone/menaquinone biosynthesis C-methylase UbiE